MRVSVALLGGAVAALYGSYSYFAPSAHRPAQMAELSPVHSEHPPATTTAVRETGSDTRQSARVFSPQAPLLPSRAGEPVQRTVTDKVVRDVPVASRRSDPFGEPPVIQAVQSKNAPQAIVAPAPVATRKSGPTRPVSEEARANLVRDLQRELKRVGCYDGEITGAWGQTTRRAMTDFTDRVNASLPVDEPDYILLSLVQSHANQACGTCPPGQLQTSAGRCQPRAIIAQNGKKSPAIADARAVDAPSRTHATGTLDQRTALPSSADSDAQRDQRTAVIARQPAIARPSALSRTGETDPFPSAVPAPTQPRIGLPSAQGAASTTDIAAAVQPSAAPLPGRMSIGAPIQPVAPVPSEAANGWQTGSVSGSVSDDPSLVGKVGPQIGKSSAGRRTAARQDHYSPPRAYTGRSASWAPSRSRSSSLRSNQGVRDFFFGPNRNSY